MKSILARLHQAERNKEAGQYIELASELLTYHRQNYPGSILQNIRTRKDLFEKKARNPLKIEDLIGRLAPLDAELISRCAPSHQAFRKIPSRVDGSTETCTNLVKGAKDLSITKDRNLCIDWRSELSQETDREFYQIDLADNAHLIRLETKSHKSYTDSNASRQVVQLDNELMPVFITSRKEASLTDLVVEHIPFPTLLRNGYHYAELVDAYPESETIESLRRFANHIAQSQEAKRVEQIIFSADSFDLGIGYSNELFREWLQSVHGIEVTVSPQDTRLSLTLFLPQRAIPSLSVILLGINPQSEAKPYFSTSIIAASAYDLSQMHKLRATFPTPNETAPSEHTAPSLPYFLDQNNRYVRYADNEMPVCITTLNNEKRVALFPDLAPIANNIDNANAALIGEPLDIVPVIKCHENAQIDEGLILSIFGQTRLTVNRPIFYLECDKDTESVRRQFTEIAKKWILPTEHDVTWSSKELLSCLDKNTLYAFIDANIIIQDSSLLFQLGDILDRNKSFSTGCVLGHVTSSRSKEIYCNSTAGMYPSLARYTSEGVISLIAKNITATLIPTEMNVIANSPDLCMFKGKSLMSEWTRDVNSSNLDLALLEISCKAVAEKMANTITTRRAAHYLIAPTPNNEFILSRLVSEQIVANLKSIREQTSDILQMLP